MKLHSIRRPRALMLAGGALVALAVTGCTWTGNGQIPSATNNVQTLVKALPSGSPLAATFQWYYRSQTGTLVGNYSDPGGYLISGGIIVASKPAASTLLGGGLIGGVSSGPIAFNFNNTGETVTVRQNATPTVTVIPYISYCNLTKSLAGCNAAAMTGFASCVNVNNFHYVPTNSSLAAGLGDMTACQGAVPAPGALFIHLKTGAYSGYANYGLTKVGVINEVNPN